MSTPYKRDIVKALKDACHKQGLKFGLYYSHNIDWEHPQNAILNGGKHSWMNLTDFKPEQMNKEVYLKEKAYPQLRELLTNYGKIDILWFDMGTGLNNDEVRNFVKICKELQPEILISSRIGAEVSEKKANRDMLFDFYTPDDNFFTGDDLPMPWEMVGTTNGSWGYRSDDTHWRTPKMILSSLLACASRNGNYMLNKGNGCKKMGKLYIIPMVLLLPGMKPGVTSLKSRANYILILLNGLKITSYILMDCLRNLKRYI
jgi:alpha-L-fucosidase